MVPRKKLLQCQTTSSPDMKVPVLDIWFTLRYSDIIKLLKEHKENPPLPNNGACKDPVPINEKKNRRHQEGNASYPRMEVEYNDASASAGLTILHVKGDDEATYKCEITYLEVVENCDVVQIVKLKVLSK
nr:unnamed protein product [Callosobruchus analis]